MKVLHVNKFDDLGGASTAMLRLHHELIRQNVDSVILADRTSGRVEKAELISQGLEFQLSRLSENVTRFFLKLQKDESLFFNSINIRPNSLLERINEINPDVVHLHWVGLGVLRIEDLPKINRPIVWTLHDMWAFCGSEHYNLGNSERWKYAYSKESRSSEARGLDLTRLVWRRKIKAWSKVALATISPSSWMRDCAANSSLWKGKKIVCHKRIYNGLDEEVFRPHIKKNARDELKLSDDLPILLFGASSINSNLKGADLLIKALDLAFKTGLRFQLIIFGAGRRLEVGGISAIYLGRVNDPVQLSKVYSAADIMLVPSRMESFGQVASESLACGTPVLCFDSTGLKDIVLHKRCGYRAEPYSVQDFVAGLKWLLQDADMSALNVAARKHVESNFQIRDVGVQHINLYKDVLQRKLSPS